MNKCIRAIVLVLALAMLLTGALAEATVTPMETLAGAEWIDGTSLLAIEGENGLSAMANIDGTPLTDAIYSSFSADGGVIIAARPDVDDINARGALRPDGTELIPFAYGDIEVLSSEWAVGVKLVDATEDQYDYTVWFEDDVYLLIDTVDVYNLTTGECLATFTRDEYADAQVYGHTINIENRSTGEVTTYDLSFTALGTVDAIWSEDLAQVDYATRYDNGYSLVDAEGNALTSSTYASITSIYGGYAKVELNGKYGLIDLEGNEVLPCEYDDVRYSYYMPTDAEGETYGYNAHGYFAVVVDGKLGYVDQQGNMTCEPAYSADVLENYGASATYTDLEGKFHIVAADGVETVVEGYADVYPLSYTGGMFYRVNTEDYDYGMIDWHGNVVLPAQYTSVEASGDGLYVLADVDYETQELYEVTLPATSGAAPADDSTAVDDLAPAEDSGEVDGAIPSEDSEENDGAVPAGDPAAAEDSTESNDSVPAEDSAAADSGISAK